MNTRTLGELFSCGKTQIGSILKNKKSLLAQYQANASGTLITSRPSDNVNKPFFEWFMIACSKKHPPMGPQLVEKAKEIATHLGKDGFKGSNGWLYKWKKIYNVKQLKVKQLKVSGESGDVDGGTVDAWKERPPELVQGFCSDDIWNMDEMGVFWKALPDRGFGIRSARWGRASWE